MKKLLANFIYTILICFSLFTESFAENKTLKIGLTADYPPFEFTKQGQLQGFSVDFAKKLGKAMNKNVEFHDMAFNALIPSLQSRKIDMIISSMTVTEERKKNVDFSAPYYSNIFSILALKSSDIKSVDQLSNKIIGVQLGSTMEEFAKSNSQKFNFKVISLDSNLILIQELNKKIIDAMIVEDVQGVEFTKHKNNLLNTKIPKKYYQNAAEYAIVLRKGSLKTEEVNEAIKKFHHDGTLTAIKEKWIK
jgi:polar amino acid transport system substrate-binding protein